MIIARVEKQKKWQHSFLRKVLRRLFITLVTLGCISSFSQSKDHKLMPDVIGLYAGIGNEHTFLFDDPDYSYKTSYIKASFQYALNHKKYQWRLAVQPQIHFLKHQLLNRFFVREIEENFEEDRITFTTLKSMRLYALTFEISVRRNIFKNLEASAFFAVGPGIIDTRTERLAKGFTFTENIGFALHYRISRQLFLALRPTFSHVSNARIQLPNSGYNVMNIEAGISWNL